MATNFITNTASLKTTIADVRKLNVKKLVLGGENILDIIKKATPTIKHSQDTRETITENDLWGQWVETKSDGTIIIHDDWVTNPNGWNVSITKVEDNLAYTSSGFYANIQTEKIKNGRSMFYYCSNLESFSSDLSSLTNGEDMFFECSNLTSFTSDLPSLTNGEYMFKYSSKLASFSSDLFSLTNGECMFYNCSNLTSFTSDLPSLTNGIGMFGGCSNLASFTSDLSSLKNSGAMFSGCNKIESFTSDLPSLTNGDNMFNYCTNLKSFNSDLSSLTNGLGMFLYCHNLESFNSDLSSLISGRYMFRDCFKLTSFTSDLSSLISGECMFLYCKLDAESVMYIADSIKDITAEEQLYKNGTIPYVTLSNDVYSAPKGFMSDGRYVYTYDNYDYISKHVKPYTTSISASSVGKLTLGINVSNNADTIQQQLEDFAKAATFDSWDILKTYFSDKGWTVIFQYGGTSDEIPDEFPDTYDLINGERIIPCPIFAKLIEIEPQGVEYDEDGNVIRENFYSDEQKNRASYCNEDASTFYNIEWGHDVTDTSSYTQFASLEDAMASWNVFPKENIISTEE